MSRPGIESFRYAQSPGSNQTPPLPARPPSFTRPARQQQQQQQQQQRAQPQLLDNAGERFQTVADFILGLPHPKYWPGLLFSFFVLDPLRALVYNFVALVTSPRTHRAVLRLSVLFSLFWAAVALAILAYIGFYRAWVPDVGRSEDLYLQYGDRGQVPFAEVDLSRWRGLAKTSSGEDWFAEEQEYDVTVDLLVPISTANLDLGNFMVSIDLVTAENMTVFRSSRPTILRPSAPPLRFLTQLTSGMASIPGIAGTAGLPLPFTSPSLELMSIKLFERLVLHPSPGSIPFSNPPGSPLETGARPRRITKALIRVGRQDADRYWMYGGGHGVGGVVSSSGMIGSGDTSLDANGMVLSTQNANAFRSRGELQTVGVGLRFVARLTGLRYFLYTYPVMSFLVFTSLFLSFELLSALTLWTIAAFYTSSLPGLDIDLAAEPQLLPQEDGPLGGGRGGGGRRTYRGPSDDSSRDDGDLGSDTETEETAVEGDNVLRRAARAAQARSLASLRARDDAEAREAQAALEEHARRTGRLMVEDESEFGPGGAAEDLLTPGFGRRVLNRLDEETEEETDDAGSLRSGVGGSSMSTLSPGERPRDSAAAAAATAAAARRLRQATVATASPTTTGSNTESTPDSSSRQDEAADEDEGDDTEQGVLIGGSGDRREEQEARRATSVRQRKAYNDDQDEEEDSRGEGSLIGGSATDPSVSGTRSARSFGATTQASGRTGAPSTQSGADTSERPGEGA